MAALREIFCVKCGERIHWKDAIVFDEHPSCTRYICPECAREEGIEVNKED